jgi:hypothetical protein
MPVLLARGDKNDVSRGHHLLFLLRGDDAFAGGDDQDLLAVVGMKLVPDPLPKFTLTTLNSSLSGMRTCLVTSGPVNTG